VRELQRGVEWIRHRGDLQQAALLDVWLDEVFNHFSDKILAEDKAPASAPTFSRLENRATRAQA
jgi:hypothetical protein